MDLVRRDVRPSRFVTRESLENGIASVAATGGSTNGVLHLLAIAHEFGIDLDIDEFGAIADRTPIVADMHPGGRYRPPTCTTRAASDWSCASCSSARACCMATRPPSTAGPSRRSPRTPRRPRARRSSSRSRPRSSRPAGWRSCAARWRPDGCVVKLAGHERRLHRGPARVFDSEAACFEAVSDRRIVAGRRRRDPVRRAGRRSRDAGDAERHRRAGRRGPRRRGRADHRRPVLGRHARADDRPHRTRRPRSADRSRSSRRVTRSSSTSIARRSTWRSRSTRSRAGWPPGRRRPPNYVGGVLAKYAALVGSASSGAVTTGAPDDRQPRGAAHRSMTPSDPDRHQDLAAGSRLEHPRRDVGSASATHDVFESVWMNDHLIDVAHDRHGASFESMTAMATLAHHVPGRWVGHGGPGGDLPAPRRPGQGGDGHGPRHRRPVHRRPGSRLARGRARSVRHPDATDAGAVRPLRVGCPRPSRTVVRRRDGPRPV